MLDHGKHQVAPFPYQFFGASGLTFNLLSTLIQLYVVLRVHKLFIDSNSCQSSCCVCGARIDDLCSDSFLVLGFVPLVFLSERQILQRSYFMLFRNNPGKLY